MALLYATSPWIDWEDNPRKQDPHQVKNISGEESLQVRAHVSTKCDAESCVPEL